MNKLLILIMSLTIGYSQTPVVLESDFVGDTIVVVGDYNIAKSNTPVAYTDISKEQVEVNEGQDIAYQLSKVPGVYVRNDAGARGQTKLWVRGFDEQRLNISINNVPVSDETSKLVWWPNWEAVKDNTRQIQVQRGVSSSLYGIGNLGGSVHISTEDTYSPETKVSYSTWNGDSRNARFSVGKTTENFTTKLTYLRDYGFKQSQYFESFAYYFGGKTNIGGHTLKTAFHGSPALYTLHFYGQSPSTFAKYGRNYSGNVHVESESVKDEPFITLGDIFSLAKGGTESVAGSFINAGDRSSLDNSVYHKPQLELHHSYTFGNDVELTNDAYYSWGNGYLALTDRFYFIGKDDSGLMSYETLNAGAPWFPNLYQYSSWVDHKQLGLVTTLSKTINNSKVYVGIDNRLWLSDHIGYVNNGFGAGGESYFYDVGGVGIALSEGGKIWDFEIRKPQTHLFVRGLTNIGKFSLMGDLQYSSIEYNVDENMVSTNNTTGSPISWTRKFNIISPKAGVVYQHNNDLSARVSVSKSLNEPRVRAMFNYGNPKEDITLEEVVDTEFGVKYKTFGLNLYNMDFSGKNLLITNPEMANIDDYDYKGRKYVPIGDANYSGLELYGSVELPYGLVLDASYSKSKNVWGTPFGEEGRSVLYQDSTDTETKYETGFPQTMLTGNLRYQYKNVTAVLSSRYYDGIYIMENNSEVSVDGYNDETGEWVSTKDSATLPSSFLTDLSVRYGVSENLDVQLQIRNLLDTEYWSSASSWGFNPGAPRSSELSVSYRF